MVRILLKHLLSVADVTVTSYIGHLIVFQSIHTLRCIFTTERAEKKSRRLIRHFQFPIANKIGYGLAKVKHYVVMVIVCG